MEMWTLHHQNLLVPLVFLPVLFKHTAYSLSPFKRLLLKLHTDRQTLNFGLLLL